MVVEMNVQKIMALAAKNPDELLALGNLSDGIAHGDRTSARTAHQSFGAQTSALAFGAFEAAAVEAAPSLDA